MNEYAQNFYAVMEGRDAVITAVMIITALFPISWNIIPWASDRRPWLINLGRGMLITAWVVGLLGAYALGIREVIQ